MKHKHVRLLIAIAILSCGGCTSTRYLTDQTSINRQHDLKAHRVGKNIGDGCLNMANMIIAGILNSDFEAVQSERTFKRIAIVNQSTDSLFVNMVTDIIWKETGYCDVMGIALPPGAKQKLLLPCPAAYNVYFKTRNSEKEEKIEIRTDSKLRAIKLRQGMTDLKLEK